MSLSCRCLRTRHKAHKLAKNYARPDRKSPSKKSIKAFKKRTTTKTTFFHTMLLNRASKPTSSQTRTTLTVWTRLKRTSLKAFRIKTLTKLKLVSKHRAPISAALSAQKPLKSANWRKKSLLIGLPAPSSQTLCLKRRVTKREFHIIRIP